MSSTIQRTPVQIIESKLRFEGKPLSFDNYPLSKCVLNTKWPTKMIIGGRQISKSIMLMADDYVDILGVPFHKSLYVAPRIDQVRAYSNEKISDRLTESPDIRKWYMDKNTINNVFLKTFRNGAKMYFRAESQTNSIRGLSVHKVKYDEIQNMQNDNIIIIDETMSGRMDTEKWYAGTPLSTQNIIEHYWSTSQKITPIMVCPAGHHQPPYLYNIFKDGVRCYKCKEKIDVRKTYFKRMGDKDAEIMAFWIPQIVLPLHAENPAKWAKLWQKYCMYPQEKFLNEVMGISAGQGIFLVTEEDLQKCCQSFNASGEFAMWSELRPNEEHGIREMWCGIDWAVTNLVSYTVITVGGYDEYTGRFRIVYAKKFMEPDPLKVNDQIARIIKVFGVEQIVADWGSGHVANRLLESTLDMQVMRVQYTGDRIPIQWDPKAGYYKASRTLTLLNTFNQMRNQRFHFFKWSQFKEFAPHILAEYFEGDQDNRGNYQLRFDHSTNKPDDTLHALSIMLNVFCLTQDPHRQIFR